MIIKRNATLLRVVLVLLILSLLSGWPSSRARGQAGQIRWDLPLNISNSEGFRSSEPFLLADPAGMIHLFWAERTSGLDGPLDLPTDTLMYAAWDGNAWSEPVDIFIAPAQADSSFSHPQAVIDQQGRIHLIWMGVLGAPNVALFYSSVHASQAGSALHWAPPEVLANELTGSEFSLALAYEAPRTLHVLYARGLTGAPITENRAVAYLRSTDRGAAWSPSLDLYTMPDLEHGASNIRLLAVSPGILYATWTNWGKGGNGDAVYLARSLDHGKTWEDPFPLSTARGGEYERDWVNLAVLGEDHLIAMWEGGIEAYRHAQYSQDGGATWSGAVETFSFLIGENGFAEFVEDSAGTLHAFLAQRTRGGERVGEIGLWHSVWEGGVQWAEPTLEGGINRMVNPKVALVGGNRIAAAWYSSIEFEIMVMTGAIEGAPAEVGRAWPVMVPEPTATPAPTPTPVATRTPLAPGVVANPDPPLFYQKLSPGATLFLGVIPALFVIGLFVVRQQRKAHR